MPNLILLLWSRVVEIKGDNIIIMIANMILIDIVRGIIERNNFLLFLLFNATNLDKATGSPIWPKFINNDRVGRINVYRDIRSMPIILVMTIFITMLSIFTMSPPTKSIIVDLINLFFIVIFMKNIK